ncbi:GNAT family N-acetyltransferase, partial [Guyparkeria sp. 1SP6A2]|nr:GNAT family N-acetyltransferase [Guyparkeria sp. 1SP6A2]
GEGFGPADEEVLTMSKYYTQDRHSLYLVALLDNDIVGGGGIAPFQDSGSICELKKLFLLAKSRGYGGGRIIAERCLEFAKSQGFQY